MTGPTHRRSTAKKPATTAWKLVVARHYGLQGAYRERNDKSYMSELCRNRAMRDDVGSRIADDRAGRLADKIGPIWPGHPDNDVRPPRPKIMAGASPWGAPDIAIVPGDLDAS
jgi:hypothetical protein